MDDLERTFREGLLHAAAKKPPLDPIDIEDVTTRRPVAAGRRPARWLAVAAAVALVAGVTAGGWYLGRQAAIPAVPVSPPSLAPTQPSPTAIATGHTFLGPCQPTDVGTALHTNRVTVSVIGLGELQVAKLTSAYLRANGFRVISFLVRPDPAAGTTVRGSSADSPEVKLVQRFFPGAVAEGDGRADHTVDVLVAAVAQVQDPDASVPVSGQPCLPPITGNAIQVRVRNDSGTRLENVKVTFPGPNKDWFGNLAPGAGSDYADVAKAYRYAPVEAVGTGRTLRFMPADYVGEKPLAPGMYTYSLGVDAGGLTLKLVTDR
jgi:hypothetical protein